jgi:hypothetical protein
MSELRAVASMCDDERKAFSSMSMDMSARCFIGMSDDEGR